MKKFISFVILFLCFLVLVLFYLWIDRSITLSYVESSFLTERRSVELLQKLIEVEFKGIPGDDLAKKFEILKKEIGFSDLLIKKEGDVIWVDQIPFELRDDKLENVGVIMHQEN